MSYLVLARKYRPATFDEVVGQEGVVRTLKNAIDLDRVAHAYLFCGARGVGKTTVARILAKALNCEKGPSAIPDDTCVSCTEIAQGVSPDVFEIDGASNTGVDDVRTLRDNSQYLPARSRFKIYIIDEVHMLSVSAFNALLKTLEEPPAHVKFIFATTEPHKIPLTVLSRCQRFDFKRIPSTLIFDYLTDILSKEGAKIEPDGIRAIAREAAGSMRDALSLTDQVLAFGGRKVSTEQVFEALGLTVSTLFEEVIRAVLDNRPDDLMQQVEKLFDEGHDLKRFMEGLLWHVRHLILLRSLKDPGSLVDVLEEERKRLSAQAGQAEVLRWHQVFDVLSRALNELGRSPYPRLVLETALLRLSAIEPMTDLEQLLERAEQLERRIESGCDSTRASPPERVQPKRYEAPRTREQAPAPQTRQPPAQEERREGSPTWQGLVSLVSKRRPSLGSVLNHARPLEVSPERVRIALEPGSFFADQMRSKRNQRDLEQFCSEYFQGKTRLIVEEQSDENVNTLAEAQAQAEKDAEDKMRTQALSHPMVKEAIRIFGAEVEQVRPKGGKRG